MKKHKEAKFIKGEERNLAERGPQAVKAHLHVPISLSSADNSPSSPAPNLPPSHSSSSPQHRNIYTMGIIRTLLNTAVLGGAGGAGAFAFVSQLHRPTPILLPPPSTKLELHIHMLPIFPTQFSYLNSRLFPPFKLLYIY